eukprot:scaffold75004_cov36-Phaeocystis_antarctica.AAC.1
MAIGAILRRVSKEQLQKQYAHYTPTCHLSPLRVPRLQGAAAEAVRHGHANSGPNPNPNPSPKPNPDPSPKPNPSASPNPNPNPDPNPKPYQVRHGRLQERRGVSYPGGAQATP